MNSTNYNGYEDNFDYLPDVINPHDDQDESTPTQDARTKKMGSPTDREKQIQNWERNALYYNRSAVPITENPIIEDEADQINRGQMGIMDEDSHQGDIGSPVISNKKPEWYSFYASGAETDDNPGTDEDHNTTDTDNVEEDADSDYEGKNRRNKLGEGNISTLVAMGGIGAIPEGHHGRDDIHYGDDETFSHEQSKRPSQTGISGENSNEFNSFDHSWNS